MSEMWDSCSSLPEIFRSSDVSQASAPEVAPREGSTNSGGTKTQSPNLFKLLHNRILLRQLSRSSPDVRTGIIPAESMNPCLLQQEFTGILAPTAGFANEYNNPTGKSFPLLESGKTRSACVLVPGEEKKVPWGSWDPLGPSRADSAPEMASWNTFWNAKSAVGSYKVKLINEGNVRLCLWNHSDKFLGKILASKYLQRWENHRLILTDASIASIKPSGFLENAIPYSMIHEILIVTNWDSYCLRIIIPQGSLLIQVCSSALRDQWYYSLVWKKSLFRFKQIATSATTRPEIYVKETKNFIDFSTKLPVQDKEIEQTLFQVVSSLLSKNLEVFPQETVEEFFQLSSPILCRSFPPEELFLTFRRHFEKFPQSHLIGNLFNTIAQRVLKNAVDLSRVPYMTNFVLEYFLVLYRNGGRRQISDFLYNIHGPGSTCPHPGVLPNLVAVSLSGTSALYNTPSAEKSELVPGTNIPNILTSFIDSDTEEEADFQDSEIIDSSETNEKKLLPCIFDIFEIITEFDDWRLKLSQLLQSVPFPKCALEDQYFIRNLSGVIRAIGTDPRCEVHRRVMAVRPNRENWFRLVNPSHESCPDDGELWATLLETLLTCSCRRKQFVELLVDFMDSLQLLALRNNHWAQEALGLMLEMDVVEESSNHSQVWLIQRILEATESGRKLYRDICRKKSKQLQWKQNGGPSELTLPAKASDRDIARFFSDFDSLGNVKTLNLAFTRVTSASAEYIIQLALLTSLNLMSTKFGDIGLKLISEHLHQLQVLNLCETPVTDEGLVHLSNCKKLRVLNLNSTAISSWAVDYVKEKLPHLEEVHVNYTDVWM